MDRSSIERGSPTRGCSERLLWADRRRGVSESSGAPAIGGQPPRSAEQNSESHFPRVVALLGNPSDARHLDIFDWVHELGGSLEITDGISDNLEKSSGRLDRFDFCIVDADLLGDVEESVDYCLRLRQAYPDIPILLLSSEVRSHDLTAERMAICDATLRMPLARTSFFEGVEAAVNNSMFRLQRAQGRQDHRHA